MSLTNRILESKISLENKLEDIKKYENLLEIKIKELNALKEEQKILTEMRDCLLKTKEELRRKSIIFVEQIVTWGLREIFLDPTIEFKIEIEYRRNKPELNFLIKDSKTNEFLDVVDGEAGGVKDVIGVMLRFALILINSKNNFPIILDEVGKHISREYQKRFALFLRKFAEKFQRQIILVSHQNEIIDEAHLVLKFQVENGRVIVHEVPINSFNCR